MSLTPPGTGPLDPSYAGIDPALMDAFIAALTRAHAAIGGHTAAIRAELARVQVGAAALAPLKEVEDWVGDQLPRLRARNELIRRQEPDRAGPGLVRYDEAAVPFTSPRAARRAGAELARLLRDHTAATTGEAAGEAAPTDETAASGEAAAASKATASEAATASVAAIAGRDLLVRALARRDDADFAAAFFGGLGTAATLGLPARLGASPTGGGATSPERTAAELSHLFGAATGAASRVPGMAKVMDDLQRGGDGVDPVALSWLVATGRFPAAWLAAVGRVHVVVPMLNGSLKPETVALGATGRLLDALAADPAAARQAVGSAARDWPGDAVRPPLPSPLILPKPALAAVLSGMDQFLARVEPRGDPEAVPRARESFARLLAAAAGVHDERDGAHSPDAARFAFAVITAAPRLSPADAMRARLGEIAGSYVTELVAGARAPDPAPARPSRFGAFDDEALGARPAFRLSLTDAYRFLRTFAGADAHLEPFDRGVAALARRLSGEGGSAAERLVTRLGTVAGLRLAAMRAARGTAGPGWTTPDWAAGDGPRAALERTQQVLAGQDPALGKLLPADG
ncbi:hypothetical protein MF672_003850 [Actinomadura sp. ATCC 31491]|uniref:Uncharacterized protein n=1 Tax=Actinomadura luzonensis TaxID=2805427 RepID=A0ABT0FLW4_9ACTN|nr:hypothetical protein [Actinomadura luzonensis]MCK2212938.1 hypothetical protein [Actinomadura luzonensis]